MAQFEAAGLAEALEYKFAPYSNASGVIPEPSDERIARFVNGLQQLFRDAQKTGMAAMQDLGETPTGAQIIEALDSLAPEDFTATLDKMAGLYSDLCSGKPSKAQILHLPLRVRMRFYAWLQQEVVSPEAGTGAGTAAVRRLPSAAAG